MLVISQTPPHPVECRHYLHLTDKDAEAQRGEVARPNSPQIVQGGNGDLKPGPSDLKLVLKTLNYLPFM